MSWPVVGRSAAAAIEEATIAAGIPAFELMENAGAALAATAAAWLPRAGNEISGQTATVLFLCGNGNNGGDGLVAARLLKTAGRSVVVVLCCGRPRAGSGAEHNLAIWEGAGGETLDAGDALELLTDEGADGCAVVVDAIFGTGLNRELAGEAAELVTALNASGLPVVAADIPSGLCSDSGRPLGVAVIADTTVTFGCAKRGLFLGDGPNHGGRVNVADIGLLEPALAGVLPDAETIDAERCGDTLPLRHRSIHKGELGHVLIVGGSSGKSGAVVLAGTAALRCGAGLVTLAVPSSLASIVDGALAETMTRELADEGGQLAEGAWDGLREGMSNYDSVVLGPGLGTGRGASDLVFSLIDSYAGPLLLDADALNVLAEAGERGREALLARSRNGATSAVMTPHPGEMARLLASSVAEVQRDRLSTAAGYARSNHVVMVLKGAATVVCAAERTAFNLSGNPGMASAGMGDVLAGVIGTLQAQISDSFEAAAAGVFLHGLAGDRVEAALGDCGYLASDLANELPLAMASIRHGNGDEYGYE
ncbi:MAG: NAD(P)H-hydrate dehydratase [Deltaproteobacteria bacterium]|nr:NAD(P)H-hydrate dehydratase [Deltaproteobacteria bacterium]